MAKAPARSFSGTATGQVGHAEKGGKSGGPGEDATLISGASGGAGSDKQPKGTPAGGTENMRADGKSYAASLSGPKVTYHDARPSEVKVADGRSTPKGVKQP